MLFTIIYCFYFDVCFIPNLGLVISEEEEIMEDIQDNFPGSPDHHPHTQSNDSCQKSSRELLLEQRINELLEENASLKAEVIYLNM